MWSQTVGPTIYGINSIRTTMKKSQSFRFLLSTESVVLLWALHWCHSTAGPSVSTRCQTQSQIHCTAKEKPGQKPEQNETRSSSLINADDANQNHTNLQSNTCVGTNLRSSKAVSYRNEPMIFVRNVPDSGNTLNRVLEANRSKTAVGLHNLNHATRDVTRAISTAIFHPDWRGELRLHGAVISRQIKRESPAII